MILKNFGLYLLQKRYHAVWIVLLCALLPFIKIPTFSLAAIIVGLVTLHKGAKEGFFVLCWAILPGIAASFYGDFGASPGISGNLYGNFAILLVDGIGKGVAIWLMASILGRTSSWVVTLQSIAFCAVILILVLHLVIPDLYSWWLQQLMRNGGQIVSDQLRASFNSAVSADQMKRILEFASYFMTGASLLAILAFDVILLLLARSWQAVLFNPGGLSLEWRLLCIDRFYSAALLMILVFIWLGSTWLFDVLPVMFMPFVFAGLSLIHAKVFQKRNIRVPILIILYMSLLLFFPYVCTFLVVLAFLDSWFDFRSLRVKQG